ncbi:MAG: IS4 family transposase [Oribacterium sp.]|nr:IS4 family transposase [Oribacterium sp.]
MLNRIVKLIKNVKALIASDQFKAKHCLEETAFTRNRKLSFQDIMYFILGLPRKSLPTELDLFFEDKAQSVSKQAFSKARYKVSSGAFEELFRMTTDICTFNKHPKTWDGYRVFAIDGSDIAVNHNKNNAAEFGLKTNNHASYPMARLSALYDVTNDLIVDVQFTGISFGEREHAHKLLESTALTSDRKHKKLIIFDRGYPSRSIIYDLEEKGLFYLIRCAPSFISCVNECPDGDHTVVDVYKGRTTRLRVLKDCSGEEPSIFISNLFEEHQDTTYHKNLYHRRWEIETKYGEIKTRMRVENFSGIYPRAIRQDLYAALFISNISALIKASAENDIKDKLASKKHQYQLNRSFIIGTVCRLVRSLTRTSNNKKQLGALIARIQKMRSIVRPDRHFTRISGHHGTTNGFYIRINI